MFFVSGAVCEAKDNTRRRSLSLEAARLLSTSTEGRPWRTGTSSVEAT